MKKKKKTTRDVTRNILRGVNCVEITMIPEKGRYLNALSVRNVREDSMVELLKVMEEEWGWIEREKERKRIQELLELD